MLLHSETHVVAICSCLWLEEIVNLYWPIKTRLLQVCRQLLGYIKAHSSKDYWLTYITIQYSYCFTGIQYVIQVHTWSWLIAKKSTNLIVESCDRYDWNSGRVLFTVSRSTPACRRVQCRFRDSQIRKRMYGLQQQQQHGNAFAPSSVRLKIVRSDSFSVFDFLHFRPWYHFWQYFPNKKSGNSIIRLKILDLFLVKSHHLFCKNATFLANMGKLAKYCGYMYRFKATFHSTTRFTIWRERRMTAWTSLIWPT
jgi:hypothetical protein